ncbi:T9SS type A sorting domain-containing protein [bacterium]|nr:T9SS type A sorting domain-containing protein [bacterium]
MRNFIVILLLFMLSFSLLKASHVLAGDIEVAHISGNEYRLALSTYTDFGPGAVDRCLTNLDIWEKNGSQITTILDIPRRNGPANTNPALGCPLSAFEGQNIYGTVKENLYDTTFTFPGPGVYLVRYFDFFRREDIVNIKDPGQASFFIETEITVTSATEIPNSSPVLLNFPLNETCTNTFWTHNPGAFDRDGDSLSYRLVNCQQYDPTSGITIPRVCTNYLFPDNNFFGMSTLLVDHRTGIITWDTPQQAGVYSLAYEVVSFRKGIETGRIVRDMVIFVQQGCGRDRPVIEAPEEVCAPALSSTKIDFWAIQNSGSDSTYLDFNSGTKGDNGPFQSTGNTTVSGIIIDNGVPGATFSQLPVGTLNGFFISDTLKATLEWAPACEDIRKQFYALDLMAHDKEVYRGTSLAQLTTHHQTRIQVLPPAPDSLKVTHDQFGILLNWSPNPCTEISGYRVYRKINPGNWSPNPNCCQKARNGGYILVKTLAGRNRTYFVDNPTGLSNEDVCYVVTTIYGGFPSPNIESCISQEVCEFGFTTALGRLDDPEIQLYPNPAGDALFLDGVEEFYGEIKVFDARGQEYRLPESRQPNGIQLETKGLSPGLYVLRISENGKWWSGRFLKK